MEHPPQRPVSPQDATPAQTGVDSRPNPNKPTDSRTTRHTPTAEAPTNTPAEVLPPLLGAAGLNMSDIDRGDRPWPVWAEGVLESMRSVPSLARAAKNAGIARSTVQRFQVADADFATAMDEARAEALDTLEEVMLLRARQGQPIRKVVTKVAADGATETITTEESHISDVLGMFYLKRWRPEYRETFKVETTGAGGGPIQVEGVMNIGVGRFRAEVVRLAAERGQIEAPK